MNGSTFKQDLVLVNGSVTQEMMTAVETASDNEKPTLSFTAYAIQYYKSEGIEFPVADAWTAISGS